MTSRISLAFAITLLSVMACLGQTVQDVQQLFYSGSTLQYVCYAPARVGPTSWSVGTSTLTSIGVTTNVGTVTTVSAHNLWVGAMVTFSKSATTTLNGTYAIATVPSTTTFTVTTAGVSNATYTDATVVTNSPLLNAASWYIRVLHYTSGVLDGMYPGGGSVSLNYQAACSNRANY